MFGSEDNLTLVNPDLRRWPGKFTNCASAVRSISVILSGLVFSGLLGFAQPVRAAESAALNETRSPHSQSFDGDAAALREYARQIGGGRPSLAAINETQSPHAHDGNTDFVALRAYAQKIGADQPNSSSEPRFKIAEADSALGALREFLRKDAQPAPNAAPDPARRRPVPRPVPAVAKEDPAFIDAHRLGSKTCLSCHAIQAEAFGQTLMGRIGKSQPAKFDCENCHGPGSAHVQAVGCAACHGEGGISKRPGIPSLVGQDPQYLVPAMRAYVTGQRKHDLMRLVLSGLGEAEIQNIAHYYARQIPDRAQTPPIGDASAGKASTALCAGCHGDRGVSISPMWPSLAGQDAQYLADAIQGYKAGSRSKAIACAGCHGEGGVSRKPGMPSLAGMEPQYLVPAMKAYASGERKHGLMKALVSGVDDAQLNSIAQFYARQTPSRAQTSGEGNASAGNAAAMCVGCHGEAGGSVAAVFPSLAGQDAKYLTGAIKAYRDNARTKTVACGGCHGDKGISKTPGMPSLAGLAPQYLVAAMKAYTGGQRKHEVMKALLTDVSEPVLNEMAQYYAGQIPARAETPSIGDAAAGKALSAACAGCHGAQGISANPIWPSLAGQDARYLADALRGYKDGSRDNAVMKGFVAALNEQAMNDIASFYATLAPAQPARSAGTQAPAQSTVPAATPAQASNPAAAVARCAGCHGENGVSKTPGMPSLAGLAPQYLVTAMKAYVGGERKNEVMKGLLTGVSESEISEIAQYYARQVPARAETSPVGDAAAGNALSAACAGCHGAQGVSANPIWPSLAGQDARYLADALRGYKDGSRDNAMMKGFVAALNDQAINNIASHYSTLAPVQPAPPAAVQAPAQPVPPAATPAPAQPAPPALPTAPASNRAPALVRNNLLAGLDDRTVADIAAYFASLNPTRSKPSGGQGGGRDPVVVRNGLVASLDDRAIRNVASYYASLLPEQPLSARNAPVRADPALVHFTRPADGSSPGGIVSFRKGDPSRRVEQNNAICLGCHERGDRTYWNGSTHETRGVACTECHTVMRQVSRKAALKTVVEMETCFQCHKDRRAQIFRSSHMPLREGKMTCSNCHNPHGSATEAMLKENSINDTCYKCHAEKRGPFLFEHAPVRENCLSCHDPHGSNTEYMLKVSRPRLCAECHGMGHGSLANGPRTVETFGRSCQNCHTAIHGSNSPSGALLQR